MCIVSHTLESVWSEPTIIFIWNSFSSIHEHFSIARGFYLFLAAFCLKIHHRYHFYYCVFVCRPEWDTQRIFSFELNEVFRYIMCLLFFNRWNFLAVNLKKISRNFFEHFFLKKVVFCVWTTFWIVSWKLNCELVIDFVVTVFAIAPHNWYNFYWKWDNIYLCINSIDFTSSVLSQNSSIHKLTKQPKVSSGSSLSVSSE